jgi:DNA-binding transcriptional ArsR family regulator
MRRVLWWLVGGSRGGPNRLRIIRAIEAKPRNTNQLAEALALDYKTVQHHLELLEENNVLTTTGDEYGTMYFVSEQMEQNLDVLAQIADEADIDPEDDHDA